MPLKLGKKPATPSPHDLKFSAFADLTALPTPPTNFGHGRIYHDGEDAGGWQMNGNGPDDTVAPGFQGVGDCVPAMAGHVTREMNKVVGHTVTITGKETVSDYSGCTGYVLGQSQTDQGTDMREWMGYWQHTGVLDAHGARHKIGAYVALDANDVTQLWQACWLFGAVAIGFNFQQAQDDQFNSGDTWDYVPGSPSLGGHCVPAFGRVSHRIGIVSWARHLWFTQTAYENLNDETWAFISQEQLRNGKSERGFDYPGLAAALAQIQK